MTTVKITDLPVATSVGGTNVLPIVQSDITKQVTKNDFLVDATLTNPNLGTPSAGILTNCTNLPIDAGTTGTLPVNRGGTGITSFGTGIATFLGTPSSANLAAALTDETGSGSAVFNTNPILVTPTLGVATATTLNKVTITAPATSATLTIADGKTHVVNNSITLAGTDATVMTFPTTSASIARIDAAQTFAGTQTFSGAQIYGGIRAQSAAAPTIASATTIAPTTQIVFVSGTTAIDTITPPAPIASGGGQITIIPTGVFTTTLLGNIALASTAVVSKALIMTYDVTTAKWYPSY